MKQLRDEPRITPRIGLALGAGGARGFAHIGVLQKLEENGITVHCLAGSSMGALIGSLYAVGLSPQRMRKFIAHLPQKLWLDYKVSRMGFIAGEKVKELIRLLTKNKNIEEADIPLAIVATHLKRGERVVFRQGSIAEAVRASISIPGIFEPAVIAGQYYVDGAVVDRLPVSVLREMGADLLIAVDVSSLETMQNAVTSVFDVIVQSIDIMQREILKHRMVDVDVLIRPDVGSYSSMMYHRAEVMIREGERAAEKAMPAIKEAIRAWREINRNG